MKKRRSPPRASAAPPPAPAAPPPAPAARAPTYDDLLAIVRLVESGSRFSEFRLRSGDIEVEVRRANGADVGVAPPASPQAIAPRDTPSPIQGGGRTPALPAGGGRTALPEGGGSTPATEFPPGTVLIRSPMVGTFYRAPEPGAPPFVEVGSRVAPDAIVCIIEVMKLMNSVTAGVKGVVTHVLVENSHMVEYGQPLVAIRPE